jgi:hypothetical protein
MKSLNYALLFAVLLLTYSIRTQAQTTNFEFVSYQNTFDEHCSHLYTITQNHFTGNSQRPNLMKLLDNKISNYEAFEISKRNPIRTNRLISGSLLAFSYGATVFVDFLYDDGFRQYTLIPLIGPFITIGKIESHKEEYEYWPGAKGLLILSGVAQSAFATYFVISLTKHSKLDKMKNITLASSLNSMTLKIRF